MSTCRCQNARHLHALAIIVLQFHLQCCLWNQHWGATTQKDRLNSFSMMYQINFDGIHPQSKATYKTVSSWKEYYSFTIKRALKSSRCVSLEIRCKRFQTFLLNIISTCRCHDARHLYAQVIIVLQFHLQGCLMEPTPRRNHTERDRLNSFSMRNPNRFDGFTLSEAPYKTVHIERNIIILFKFDIWTTHMSPEGFDLCKSWFKIRCKRFQSFLLNTISTCRCHINARHLYALAIIVLLFHLQACLMGPTLRHNHIERQVVFILWEIKNLM